MLLSNVRQTDRGFTLIETTIIVVIVGILSAIAAPSFIGMLNRNKVNNALTQVRGALQETQREAMRHSKNCTVVVPAGSNITLTSPNEDTNGNGLLDTGEDINSNGVLDTNSCLITGARKLDGVNTELSYSGAGNWTITFDFKGRTNLVGSAGTMVFSTPDTSSKKCLVVSQGLGLIRTGNYTGTGSIVATNCDTSQ